MTEMQEINDKLSNIEKMMLLSCKDVLSVNECSILTGLSSSQLYAFTSKKKIPHYKPRGRLIYFKKSEIEEWMLQNRQATTDEIEQQAKEYCSTH